MTLSIGEAAKAIGVSHELLRHLCDDGVVAGTRGKGGHWHFEIGDLPTRDRLVELVTGTYQRQLAKMNLAISRVRAEVEGIQLDVQEQIDAAPEPHAAGQRRPQRHQFPRGAW